MITFSTDTDKSWLAWWSSNQSSTLRFVDEGITLFLHKIIRGQQINLKNQNAICVQYFGNPLPSKDFTFQLTSPIVDVANENGLILEILLDSWVFGDTPSWFSRLKDFFISKSPSAEPYTLSGGYGDLHIEFQKLNQDQIFKPKKTGIGFIRTGALKGKISHTFIDETQDFHEFFRTPISVYSSIEFNSIKQSEFVFVTTGLHSAQELIL